MVKNQRCGSLLSQTHTHVNTHTRWQMAFGLINNTGIGSFYRPDDSRRPQSCPIIKSTPRHGSSVFWLTYTWRRTKLSLLLNKRLWFLCTFFFQWIHGQDAKEQAPTVQPFSLYDPLLLWNAIADYTAARITKSFSFLHWTTHCCWHWKRCALGPVLGNPGQSMQSQESVAFCCVFFIGSPEWLERELGHNITLYYITAYRIDVLKTSRVTPGQHCNLYLIFLI